MAGRSESVKKVLVEFGDSKDVFELTCVGIHVGICLPGLPRGREITFSQR